MLEYLQNTENWWPIAKKKKKSITTPPTFYQIEIEGTLKSKQKHDRDSNILTFL